VQQQLGLDILPAAVAADPEAVQQLKQQRAAAQAALRLAAALYADVGNAQMYNATEVSLRACSCLRSLMCATTLNM
jgi:hypothetical protein